MQEPNIDARSTLFERYVTMVGCISPDIAVRSVESGIEKTRAELLAAPLTAWALTLVSSWRMRAALEKGNDLRAFILADILVRPLAEIIEETEHEKRKHMRLEKVPSPKEKVWARLRASQRYLGELINEDPERPSQKGLLKILGPDSKIRETLGERYAGEVFSALLSTQNPNFLIPAVDALLAVMEQSEGIALRSGFLSWERQRQIKATPTGIFKKIDHKALEHIDAKLSQIRANNPALLFREFFNAAVTGALAAHGQVLPKNSGPGDLRRAWQNVAAAQASLSSLTHATLATIKYDQQTAAAPGGRVTAATHRPERDSAGGSPPAPIATLGGLLTDRDIASYVAEHG